MPLLRFPLITLFLFLICSVASAAEKRERLAVLDLEAKFGVEADFAEALSMVMRDEIHSHGEYSVMSREDLRAVASREQLLQAMGCDSGGNCLVDFGRAIGTRFMVVGAISKIGGVYIVNLRMLDTKGENAGLVHRVSRRCKCDEEALIGTIQGVAAEIIGKTTTKEETQKQLDKDKKRIAELEADRKKMMDENERLLRDLKDQKTASAAGLSSTNNPPSSSQITSFVTIGTGGVTGVYYPTGGAICRLVNKQFSNNGLRCSVESTGGSVYNLNAIAGGKLDLGIAQSDWQYHAYHGSSKFSSSGPNRNLRSVFSVHPEPFTLLARKDSGIKDLFDLKGKRVNIGNPGSGQRLMFDRIMEKTGMKRGDFRKVTELRSSEQISALCANKVDAISFVIGHPSGFTKQATTSCKATLVKVSGNKINELISENPYYRTTTIPGGMYPGNNNDVKTFGVGATLITSSKVPREVIYKLVKAVFENFDQFRKLHPAFMNLKKSEMIRDSLSAPLHDGARQYYREAGLL